MRVLDELRPRGRAGREVQQQRVGGRASRRRARTPPAPGRRRRTGASRRRRRRPRSASSRRARRRTWPASAERTTTWRALPRSMRSRRSASASSVVAGDHDRAELHRREHRLPQLDLVAEHEQDPVAARDALGAQPVRELVRAPGQRVEAQLAARSRPPPRPAARSASLPRASGSNQSSAQLNSPSCGHANAARAAS